MEYQFLLWKGHAAQIDKSFDPGPQPRARIEEHPARSATDHHWGFPLIWSANQFRHMQVCRLSSSFQPEELFVVVRALSVRAKLTPSPGMICHSLLHPS